MNVIAFALALVATVGSDRHIHRKGTMSRRRAIVQRTVSVPLIAASLGRLKADQGEYLFHRDLIANPVKVDTWHSILSSDRWLGGGGRERRTVPFPFLNGERERSSHNVNHCAANQPRYGGFGQHAGVPEAPRRGVRS